MPGKKLAFTIVFGDERYHSMAKVLEATIAKYSPSVPFKIFTDKDFTPLNDGLPRDRRVYPKDLKFPKLEVLSRLSDEDTTYMFIDADSLVFTDLSPYFDLVQESCVMIEYVPNGSDGWAGVNDLQFVENAAKVGILGLQAISINSGFIVWRGKQPCFKRALDLIKRYTIPDRKGRKGDEYYLCAGLQLEKTNIIPLDYDKVPLGKFWNGDLRLFDGKIQCAAYPKNDRLIVHYGNSNYDHPVIKSVSNEYYKCNYNFEGFCRFRFLSFKRNLKKILRILGWNI